MNATDTEFVTDPAIDLIRTAIPEDKPDWTENLCWTMHDPQTGLSLYAHLGRMQPNRAVWEGLSLLYLPNGEALVNRSLGVNPSEARNREYHYRPVIPNKIWNFQFDGVMQRVLPEQLRTRPVADEPFEPVSYELIFEAVQPVYNRDHSSLDSEKMHLEQGGTIRGAIVVDGTRMDINCTGYRDHSVSRRTFRTLDLETWAHCTFPSGKVFGILEVRRTEVQIMNGQVFQHNRIQRASAETIVDLSATDGSPHAGVIHLQLDSGPIEINYQTAPSQSLAFNLLRPVGLRPGLDLSNPENMLAVQCPAKFTWDGEIGYGWLERARPTRAII
ncbi:MAG: hypothetical protein OXC05_16455 [Halieaceae bacterium]|nr:hypothetical protein [Halieaceae bacterium]